MKSARRWFRILAAVGCFSAMAAAVAAGAAQTTNVVLVHGIWDRGRIFAPMVRALERQGCRCLAPSLTPNDGSAGIRPLAQQLAARIDARFGPTQPVVLVGFSLGGLVTRDYVQNLAVPGRVRGVFLISTPSHGTLWALLACGSGTRQLGCESPAIQALNRDDRAWRRVPIHAYWTPYDLMIVPATSTRWPAGHTQEIFCPLHPWMVRNPGLIADLRARIAALTRDE